MSDAKLALVMMADSEQLSSPEVLVRYMAMSISVLLVRKMLKILVSFVDNTFFTILGRNNRI